MTFSSLFLVNRPWPLLCLAGTLLACHPVSAQTTYTFNRSNFGQGGTRPDGYGFTFPDNNLWTQPYTISTDTNNTPYVSAVTNWNPNTSYPNGAGVSVIINPQIDPKGRTELDGVHLNDTVSIQNMTLTTGALLLVDSANSGGVQNHAITFDLADSAAGTVQNDGTINILSTNVPTTVQAVHALTISGGGTFNLGRGAIFSGPGTVTLASGSLIQGGGGSTINAPFVNRGTITASGYSNYVANSVPITELYLTGTITNQGALRSAGEGTLYLSGSTINNAGGLIYANNSTPSTSSLLYGIVLNANTAITGGTLAGSGTDPNGIAAFRVTDSGASLTNVTIYDGTAVRVDTLLKLNDNISNGGTITVNDYNFGGANPGPAQVNIASNTTLSGVGSINLIGAGELTTAAGATLTQNFGHTIQGSGVISGTVVNAGVIDSNANGQLIVQGTLTNTNIVRASGSSVLYLNGTVNNTNGAIISGGSGSYVDLVNGVSVTGGTLASVNGDYTGGGIVRIGAGGATLTNVGINTGSAVRVDNSLAIFGTLTNNGSVVLPGFNFATNVNSTLTVAANAMLAGNGTVELIGGEIDATNNATLTTAAGQTIFGRGTINASFVNNGTVRADLGFVYPYGNGTVTINSPSFTNNGVLAATNNTDVQQASNSTLTNYNAATQTLTGGTYSVTASTNGNANLNLNIGNVSTNNATVVLSGANANFSAINGLTNNQGTFSLLGGRNFNSVGALANAGHVNIGTNSTLAVNGVFTQSSTGLLTGTGTLTATTANLGGTISPGNSPGVLHINAAVVLGPASMLEYQLGDPDPALGDDRIDVAGSLTLDGTVDISDLGALHIGTYDLINFSGLLTDHGLDIGRAPAGFQGAILTVPAVPGISGGMVELLVTAVPEPSALALLGVGAMGAGIVTLCRRRACA